MDGTELIPDMTKEQEKSAYPDDAWNCAGKIAAWLIMSQECKRRLLDPQTGRVISYHASRQQATSIINKQ